MRSAQEVFDEWGQDHRGQGMQKYHWPRVKQAFDLIPNQTGNYLEIGTGTGYAIEYMAKHQFSKGHCYGLEISEQMVRNTKTKLNGIRNVTIEQGDFLQWDFDQDLKFALIFSMEVFYYFPDMLVGLKKAYSLLQPGGQLWVLVNYYHENSVSHGWPEMLNTPMQMWSKQDYRKGFAETGFGKVEQLQLTSTGGLEFKEKDAGTLCTYGTR
ncbi:class I SAM-dependent methyltransferase [bacterium]|nr:class I SAM-dependent methyltransferase [bacterium]